MRWKMLASALLVLALLIPTSSAVAQTGSSRTDEATCQAVTYVDIRERFDIDLETASDAQIRELANTVSSIADNENLFDLYDAVQHELRFGTPEELRTFLQTTWHIAWTIDLRAKVLRAKGEPGAGANVQATAQQALNNGTTDTLLTYLNHGLYVARALDACEAQPA